MVHVPALPGPAAATRLRPVAPSFWRILPWVLLGGFIFYLLVPGFVGWGVFALTESVAVAAVVAAALALTVVLGSTALVYRGARAHFEKASRFVAQGIPVRGLVRRSVSTYSRYGRGTVEVEIDLTRVDEGHLYRQGPASVLRRRFNWSGPLSLVNRIAADWTCELILAPNGNEALFETLRDAEGRCYIVAEQKTLGVEATFVELGE